MKLTEDQETAALLASRALNRAEHAIAEAERIDELTLYLTQRGKWIEQTAPRLAKLMESWSDEAINRTWDSIGEDYKRAVWKCMPDTQKDRIRAVRKAAA